MKGRDFLASMATRSRERAIAARQQRSESALLREVSNMPAPASLQLDSFDIIAEVKLRSPAAGQLQTEQFDRNAQIQAYARSGACAVSILTEPDAFDGDLAHLREAAEVLSGSGVPAMRKDFLTDPYQVIEAREAGAGGVLIIVTMLDDELVAELLSAANEMGMFALLEGFDSNDLDRIARFDLAQYSQPILAGVNCRDLKTLEVNFGRFASLSQHLPSHLLSVAESGITQGEDVHTVAEQGYRLALIGSALMTAGNPAASLQAFLKSGRSAQQVDIE